MIKSTIFKTTSFRESKNFLRGLDFFSPTSNMEIPKKIVKKITCNIDLLFPIALIALSGTISIRNCKGPLLICFEASDSLDLTPELFAYVSVNF